MKKNVLSGGAILAFACGGALAQQPSSAPTEVTLAPVNVTATRTAETADQTLASVSVVTRKDIERQQSFTVDEALRGLAGIQFSNNGGIGAPASMFLRGTNSDQVLVLIDGVRVGSATLGTFGFENLAIGELDRIEVVRGPRSSLYGSEAIGGVVQFFTRRGGGPLTAYGSIGAGTYSTSRINAGLNGGGESSWFNANFSNVDTQGFNSCSPPNTFSGCFAIEPDRDSFRSRSGSLRAGHRFDNGAEVDLSALATKNNQDFDGSFVNRTESTQQVYSGRVRFSPLDPWKVSLLAGESKEKSDNYLNLDFRSRFDTTRQTFSFQNDVAVAANQVVTVGYDYFKDRVGSDTEFTRNSRSDNGVYGQYLARFGANTLQGSVRYDDIQGYGGQTTGNGAWGYEFAQDHRVTLSYGTAFKAPTFNQLFFPIFGNPNLRPEDSNSFEVGMSGSYTSWRWQASAYQTKIDNLIAFDANTFRPENVDRAKIRGFEAMAAATIYGVQSSLNVTLLDPRNDGGGPNNGNVLPRRAEQLLRVDLDRPFGPFSVGGTFAAEGRRYDDLANTRRLGGFGTLALRAAYRPHKDWALQLSVNNLFDKDYQTALYFNQPGTVVFFTLRYQPAGT
jgi:vitamin B12 transporter